MTKNSEYYEEFQDIRDSLGEVREKIFNGFDKAIQETSEAVKEIQMQMTRQTEYRLERELKELKGKKARKIAFLGAAIVLLLPIAVDLFTHFNGG